MRPRQSCSPTAAMASSASRPTVLALAGLVLLVLVSLGPGSVRGNKLRLLLQKREAPAPAKTNVAVDEHKAKEFLGGLKRAKRQLEEFSSGMSDWEFSKKIMEMNLRSEEGSSDHGPYGANSAIISWIAQNSKSSADEFIHDEHEVNLREREQESFWPAVDDDYY